MRLCNRGRSGFGLTAEGERVYAATSQLFASIEVFRSQINDTIENLSGTLYIGLVDTIVTYANSRLHRAITAYTTKYRNVQMRIISGSSAEIYRAVQDMRVHIGVTVPESEHPDIVALPLFEETSKLYCARTHPLFAVPDDKLTATQLEGCSFVQHGYSDAERDYVTRMNLSPKSVSHVTEGVLFLILTGNYLGFLPSHYAELWARRGDIRPLLVAEATKTTNIMGIANRRIYKNAIIKCFFDEIPLHKN
jgi:DNA-binding transcriptional LysR family regulator